MIYDSIKRNLYEGAFNRIGGEGAYKRMGRLFEASR